MAPTIEMPMRTPTDLFVHELSYIHSAERIFAQVLAEGQGMVQTPELKQALQRHEQETRQQIQNLEQIFQRLGAQPHPIESHAAQGLHQSLHEVAQANPSPEVLEGALLAGQAKSEHLEIACYTGLVTKARAMGQTEVAQLLEQNLRQEQAQAQRVEAMAEQMAQRMASTTGAQGGDQASAQT